jgi:hypothetical protein
MFQTACKAPACLSVCMPACLLECRPFCLSDYLLVSRFSVMDVSFSREKKIRISCSASRKNSGKISSHKKYHSTFPMDSKWWGLPVTSTYLASRKHMGRVSNHRKHHSTSPGDSQWSQDWTSWWAGSSPSEDLRVYVGTQHLKSSSWYCPPKINQ